MYYYPPEESGVIILANGSSDRPPYTWVGVEKIMSVLFNHATTIPTKVAGHDKGMPGGFALGQNYPNPFNPSTTIEFTLPQSAFVTLKVYNLLGEEVAALVSEQRMAGIHKINWDARGLASGVYLYRLEAGDPSTSLPRAESRGSGRGFVQTRKLILLR